MLHEGGASEEEAVAYVERWSARPREYAQSGVRHAGPAVARVRGDVLPRRRSRPAARPGEPRRYLALLTEQTRVADMLPVSSEQ